ncbi:MAG: TonB family protein, partial [Myxococcales bacterium]|nr:TonB family protein [Myxococcales bacterium]
ATGALVAAALAVLMALGCAQNVDVMALFGALAYAAPSERAQMLTIGLEQIAAPWASWAVLGAGAFGALAHAGLAAWRSPPSLGRMAGALVVVGLALVVSLGESRSAYEAGPTMRDPGVELTRTPGLALLPLRAPNAPDGLPAAIVTPEGLVALDGERLAAWSEPLAPALRALHERASAERAERDRRDPYALERPAEAGGALALAFDARLRGAELIALFDAAAEADLAAIVVVGVQEGFSPEHHAALERAMPMFAAMTSPLREIAVDLSTGPSYREEAIGRYVEARAPTEVRVASDAPERGDGGRFGLAMPATTPATMVFLDDSSDVRAMARAVEAIDEERSVPVIVVRRDEARRRRELEPPNAPDDAEVPAGGVLDRDTIREVIRTHIPIVRGCYERELMRDPSLSGRVTVQITIGPTGGVQAATVTASTMQRPAVDECIARAARSWVFPAPAGGAVVVSYPFVFNSR